MIKDRGTIKWNALMLPEHVELLRDWKNNDKLPPTPELSEWELEHIEQTISSAYTQKCSVQLFIHEEQQQYVDAGIITKLDCNARYLMLNNGHRIYFSSIYRVEADVYD